MSSYTSIISKELVSVNDDEISFTKYCGLYYYTFGTNLWDMADLLSVCKDTDGITPNIFPVLIPILEVLEKFETPNYLIDYTHDFADQLDESCFTLPVLHGKIANKYIVDETNRHEDSIEAAYKIIGLLSPWEYTKVEKTKNL